MLTKRKTNPPRPRGRPRTGINQLVGVRWPPRLLAAVVKYGDIHGLSRADALRQIVAMHLGRDANQ